MKNIKVEIEATELTPVDVTIEPGTTPSEVLNKVQEISGMDLTGYALSKGDGKKFRKNQKIYPKVEDGEELYAFKVSKETV